MSHKSSTLERRCPTARKFTRPGSWLPAIANASWEGRRQRKRTLQPGGMTRFETERSAWDSLPARSPPARRVIRGGVEPKAGDHRKAVAVPSIHGNPFPSSAISKGPKFLRAHRGRNEAGGPQSVGNRAGTIVSAIIKRAVSTAVTVRLRPQLIGSPDGALHRERRFGGGGRHSTAKPGLLARYDWARGRERTGETVLDQERQNCSAQQCLSPRCSHGV